MSIPGPYTHPAMTRTEAQKLALREAAAKVVSDRSGILPPLALAADEVAGTDESITYRAGGVNRGDLYMAVVDKQHGDGFVSVSKEGRIGPQVKVGPNEVGYETVKVEQDDFCTVYFRCAVFYILRA
ncbi:hypothetical protein DL98DRAFT_651552 [Cadophora sp. DSE1049]|nr:hypothetical protein DL98DRAFT_651552 [Cadophora sp. DSE1049]